MTLQTMRLNMMRVCRGCQRKVNPFVLDMRQFGSSVPEIDIECPCCGTKAKIMAQKCPRCGKRVGDGTPHGYGVC